MSLNNQQTVPVATGIRENLEQILREHKALAEKLNYGEFEPLVTEITRAKAVFLIAAGRSGFAMRSVAMRLMHLGLRVHVVGETTTPAIQPGDLLWAASGSGSTSAVVGAAEKARKAGARVCAMTTNSASPLALLADTHVRIPAAEKQDHAGGKSRQYAGSLFEQALLLTGDAIFMELWKMDGTPAEELWKRHANIE